MQRVRFILGAITLLILLTVSAQIGQAQLRQIELRVDGLACPFCAYGLEKNLKAVQGVKDLTIDMDRGTVTLLPKEGAFIPMIRVLKAVREGGFTPGELDLVVVGRLTTLAGLNGNAGAAKAVREIWEAAKAQGLKLPENPFLLTLEKPGQIFILLRSRDKTQAKVYEQLSALTERPIVLAGTVPVPKKKAKVVPRVLFVKAVQLGGETSDALSAAQ